MSVSLNYANLEAASPVGLSIGLFCNKSRFVAKVTPGQIVTRQVQPPRQEQPVGLEAARAKVQASGYNGKMSPRTRQNVVGMLGEWFNAKKAEKGKVFNTVNAAARLFTFCTLTLCSTQMHDDNYIKRHGLNRFLQECKRAFGVQTFFWRGEPQRNGNLHFHILFAQELPWEWIRSTWNNILSDMGYLQIYKSRQEAVHAEGFKPSTNPNDKRTIAQQVKAYRDGLACGWSNPNSTDIHRLQKTKNAAAYVCKYVSKDAGSRKIDGRIWGCSDDLRELKAPEVSITQEFMKRLNGEVKRGKIELIQYDHVAVYRGDIGLMLTRVAPQLLTELEKHYSTISKKLSSLRPLAIPQAQT